MESYGGQASIVQDSWDSVLDRFTRYRPPPRAAAAPGRPRPLRSVCSLLCPRADTRTSWLAPSLELGGILYDTLFGLAPNLQSLFKRPRDAIALK